MRKNGSDSIKCKTINDCILVICFLAVALLCMGVLSLTGKSGSLVRVTVQGEKEEIYDLSKDQTVDISYEDPSFSNQMIIDDGKVYIKEANCSDKICVNHKPISKSGETIVCLPHKLVIEIVDKGSEAKRV